MSLCKQEHTCTHTLFDMKNFFFHLLVSLIHSSILFLSHTEKISCLNYGNIRIYPAKLLPIV